MVKIRIGTCTLYRSLLYPQSKDSAFLSLLKKFLIIANFLTENLCLLFEK